MAGGANASQEGAQKRAQAEVALNTRKRFYSRVCYIHATYKLKLGTLNLTVKPQPLSFSNRAPSAPRSCSKQS